MYEIRFTEHIDNSSDTSSRREYSFVELSEKHLESAARLLNTEWPRSLGQRVQGLSHLVKSDSSSGGKQVPISLIVIERATESVVGHASIVSIGTVDKSTQQTVNLPFLQSIIIDKSLRSRGLGKKLMLLCEKYFIDYSLEQQSKQHETEKSEDSLDQFDHLYLNTKDQQRFYESLGYVQIEPMMFFTNKKDSRTSQMAKVLFKSMSSNAESEPIARTISTSAAASLTAPPPPPPPPPPPAPPLLSQDSSALRPGGLTWYKKRVDPSSDLLKLLASHIIPS